MKRSLVKFRNSAFRKFIRKYEKYMPLLFFIGGFIFDTLTLGRIDRLYDLVVLCMHMTALTITIYLFNRVDDGRWKNTFLERYEEYLPLAIQFFFGGLSSAYVIYFSRSVSLSKTAVFFIFLMALLFANEFLKKRISNKYLQFGVYSFISFTFFSFMLPVFLREINPTIFMWSGILSLALTLILISLTYFKSPSTRNELRLGKLLGLVLLIYGTITLFYFLRLIPPVPLALDEGMVAHNIELEDNAYSVTYEPEEWYVFWQLHQTKFHYQSGENIFLFSSIFAPTDLKKSVLHRWKWLNPKTDEWETVEDIGFEIMGGRDNGYRGYTFKKNVKIGEWQVQVLTDEDLVLGVVNFEVVMGQPKKLSNKKF